MGIAFAKGHGTGNDFVIVPDLDDRLTLTDEWVRAVCDRHFGIGADGLIRVVRAGDRFFMDYRNADGSIAEMCGNGARVFARFLVDEGLTPSGEFTILTRGGERVVSVPSHGDVSIDMGVAQTPLLRAMPVVTVGQQSWPAVGVHLPNPHAVVFVDALDDAGELRIAPDVAPDGVFPDGVNVEFVTSLGEAHIAMRVFERGVGETLSCGTGACAAAWAARRREGASSADAWVVDVPGGRLTVTEHSDGRIELSGPATIVARGHIEIA